MPYRSTYGMYGDPGFFGGLIKGIGKVAKVAGKIGKAVPGIGTAISALELGSGLGKALAGGPLKRIGLPGRGPGGAPITFGGSTGIVAPGFGPGPQLPRIPGTMPGGSSAYGGGSGGRSRTGANGYRKYRRINVGNVRALRRSMRRVEGFAKLARQTITFTKQVRMKKRRSR